MSEKPCSDDIMLWPCGMWCYRDELWDYEHMSDDYEAVPYASDKWISLNDERDE